MKEFICPYCGAEDDPGNEWGEYGTNAKCYSAFEATYYGPDRIIPRGRIRYYSHPGTTTGSQDCRTEIRDCSEISFRRGHLPKGHQLSEEDRRQRIWEK